MSESSKLSELSESSELWVSNRELTRALAEKGEALKKCKEFIQLTKVQEAQLEEEVTLAQVQRDVWEARAEHAGVIIQRLEAQLELAKERAVR